MSNNTLVGFTLKTGNDYKRFVVELDGDKAPLSVENFLRYVHTGRYNGTIFHRVIRGFMIQGGGFDINMSQRNTFAPIRNEASNGLKNDRYTIAMARTNDPHSATAQFFINHNDNDFLNHTAPTPAGWGYCVFGRVIAGFNAIEFIASQATGSKGFHQDVPKIAVEMIDVRQIEITSQGAIGFTNEHVANAWVAHANDPGELAEGVTIARDEKADAVEAIPLTGEQRLELQTELDTARDETVNEDTEHQAAAEDDPQQIIHFYCEAVKNGDDAQREGMKAMYPEILGHLLQGHQIDTHQVDGALSNLKIEVRDDAGLAGANHRYDITGFDTDNNPSAIDPKGFKSSFSRLPVVFQNGVIPEVGTNGVTIEALLAVCAHRLEGFQGGPYPSPYNQAALEHINGALTALKQRTADRLARQVEGQHKV